MPQNLVHYPGVSISFCTSGYLRVTGVQCTVEFVALLWYFVSQYQEKHCIPKTRTSTKVTTSSWSPLSTPINATEPCSQPKGCLPFYFCHRRNIIKLKLVSLKHQVYLHTVLSNSGSKLTDRPSYLNHTCRILQTKNLFPNFIHNFIIIIHVILSTL